jgi:nitroimidazol reductase NimA-like FMN-containing flavoprotein (pyridoxamine 5'-phosphate oxidase superfamily)
MAPDGPQILPVNYAVLRGSISFRTAAGSTVAAAIRDSRPTLFVQITPAQITGRRVLQQ